jgi:predicted ArsR family transcriptional regulator
LEKGEPIYISKIASALKMPEKSKLVAFHLSVLAEHGLVESNYEVRHGPPEDEKGRPIIVSYYKLTKKAKEVIEAFNL